jgi:hypothetical protein
MKVIQRFGGTCHLHLQVQRIRHARKQHEAGGKLCLFFNPEDGGNMFL